MLLKQLKMLGILFFILEALPFYAHAANLEATILGINESLIFELDTGKKASLAGVYIPPSYTAQAREKLEELAIGQKTTIECGKCAYDFRGAYTAHMHVGNTWLQGILLQEGLAAVYVLEDQPIYASEMLALEAEARAQHKGIWQKEVPVLSPKAAEENLNHYKNRFVLLEGTVAAVSPRKEQTYINFGDDWKTDTTAIIRKRQLRLFKTLNPESLVGKTIRIRGWMGEYYGPFIELYDPSQVEITG